MVVPKSATFSTGCSGGKSVPLGKFHAEEGLLLRQRGRLILQRDDGGFWILEVDGAESPLGLRVRVEGVRTGFNSLEVSRIVPC